MQRAAGQERLVAVDGVRGVAILLVILFHHDWLPFGWAGVQLFFVLSGFLITAVLLADDEPRLGAFLGRFYWRRAFRIVPPYAVYLAFIAALAYAGHAPAFIRQWPKLVTYTLNFARMAPDYVDEHRVSHLWSLALEEQFYLVWPLVIFFVPRRRRMAVLLALLCAGPLMRWGMRLSVLPAYNATQAGRFIYVLPFSQQDAFATGALAYLVRDRWTHLHVLAWTVATATALVMGLLLVYQFGAGTPASLGYPIDLFGYRREIWGYTLLNVCFALTILLGYGRHWLTRPLETMPLVHLGRISYTVYLWHLIVLDAARIGLPAAPAVVQFAAIMSANVLIGTVSLWCFERPLLALRDRRFAPAIRPEFVGA